ncbi:MAG: hypothetical protein RR256_07380, partial [Bacteroidales bacterium]
MPDRNKASYFIDTGFCFFLKFNTSGKRLWASLFGVEPTIINKSHVIDVTTYPRKMCFAPDGELYVYGTHSSTSFKNIGNNRESQWGTDIPIFGPKGANIWPYDSLLFYVNYGDLQDLSFILKIDEVDNIIWSTYCKAENIKDMQVDKNGNLYIYGGAVTPDYPPIVKKKSKLQKEIYVRDIMSSWAYIAEFNPQGKQIWCTHIGSEQAQDSAFLLPMAMDISPQGHLFLTGSTTSKKFPIVKKEGRFSMQATKNSPEENTFLMEFDTNHTLIWSTLYIDDSNSGGWDIVCNPQ